MKHYILYISIFFVFKLFSQENDFSRFKGKPIQTSLVKEISNQSFWIYVGDDYTEAKTDQQISVIIELIDSGSQNVVPVFRYNFDSGNQNYTICRFKIEVADEEYKFVTKLFFYTMNSWKIVDTPYYPLNDFLKVLSVVNEKFIKVFLYNDFEVENSLIIKEIIDDSKDSYGTIDIKKFSNYIENNKVKLVDYLLE